MFVGSLWSLVRVWFDLDAGLTSSHAVSSEHSDLLSPS